MKPSIDEVLQKLVAMSASGKKGRNWILIEQLAEELNAHCDNIIPSLLQLEREECLVFSPKKKIAVNLLNPKMAA